MEKPLTMTLPEVGTISPVRSLIMVDLPDPEGPTRNANSPSSIANEMPLRASVPLSYTFLTSIRRIINSSQYKRLQNGYIPFIIRFFGKICNRENMKKILTIAAPDPSRKNRETPGRGVSLSGISVIFTPRCPGW